MSDIDQPADRSVKVTHLVLGLFFLGIAGVWALVAGDVINSDSLAVLGPGILILAGVVGLAVSLASSRNRRTREARARQDLEHQTDQQTDHTTAYPDQSGYDDHEPTEEIR
jgi:hypothetical protein